MIIYVKSENETLGLLDYTENTIPSFEYKNNFINSKGNSVVYTYDMTIPLTEHNMNLLDFYPAILDDGVGEHWETCVQMGGRPIEGEMFVDKIDLEKREMSVVIVMDYNDRIKDSLVSACAGDTHTLTVYEKNECSSNMNVIGFGLYQNESETPYSSVLVDGVLSSMPCVSFYYVLENIATYLSCKIKINDTELSDIGSVYFPKELDPRRYYLKAGEIRIEGKGGFKVLAGWNPQAFCQDSDGVLTNRMAQIYSWNANQTTTETGASSDDFPALLRNTGLEFVLTEVKVKNSNIVSYTIPKLFSFKATEDMTVKFNVKEGMWMRIQPKKKLKEKLTHSNGIYSVNLSEGDIITLVSTDDLDNRGRFLYKKYESEVELTTFDNDVNITKSSDDSLLEPNTALYMSDIVPDISIADLLSDWCAIVAGGYEVYYEGSWFISIKTAEYSLDGSLFTNDMNLMENILEMSELVKRYPVENIENTVSGCDFDDYNAPAKAFRRVYRVDDKILEKEGEFVEMSLGTGGYGRYARSGYKLYVNDLDYDAGPPVKLKSVNTDCVWCWGPVVGETNGDPHQLMNVAFLDDTYGISDVFKRFIANCNALTVSMKMNIYDFIKIKYNGYKIFHILGRDWIVSSLNLQGGEEADVELYSFDPSILKS